MDYGQLDPSLPFDSALAPLTHADLQRVSDASSGSRVAYVGGAQWTVPAWKGTIYPRGTKSSELLEVYSRQWNSIELNSSFYSSPSASQVETWASRTPEDFRFFVKVHQELSHDAEVFIRPELLHARITAFQSTWSHLGSRWGGSFLQLPPHFSLRDFSKLKAWVRAWGPVTRKLGIEFRHESWFRNRRLVPEAEAFLIENGIGAVCTDTPGRRDASHATITDGFWMIRFLGQSSAEDTAVLPQDLERIEAWALRLSELQKRGLDFAFCIHSPEHVWVPELSRRFVSSVRGLAVHLRAPVTPEPPAEQLGFSL